MGHHRTILSVGGSIIIPKEGFDSAFLKQFNRLIRSQVEKGEQFILVIGGGKTAREYQAGLKDTVRASAEDRDWIGIHSTVLNAQFVRLMFKEIAHDTIIQDPTIKVNTTKPIIIAAGWKPGCSTDNIAVLLAETYGVTHIMNLSNIAYAYTKDPNIYKDAQKIDRISWREFRKIVGNTWDPGKSAPFDPIASKSAEAAKIAVSILDGKNLANVKKAIEGKPFDGTRIE
jgi:uridylate kinase